MKSTPSQHWLTSFALSSEKIACDCVMLQELYVVASEPSEFSVPHDMHAMDAIEIIIFLIIIF